MLGEIVDALKGEVGEKVPNKVPNKVSNKVPNKNELEILGLLKECPTLTRMEIAWKTGLSDGGVKKILAVLKSTGWIERVGSNKRGSWIVKYM